MATEEGIVIKIDSSTAWVKTTKTHACKACGARASCNVMGGGKEMEVEAINYAGAKVGEKVVLFFETSPLLKATFMLYVLPVLFLIAGAFIGTRNPIIDMKPVRNLQEACPRGLYLLWNLLAHRIRQLFLIPQTDLLDRYSR